MDDNETRPVVEFPFDGGYLAIKRPTESQMMLLAMSRATDDPSKLIRRLLQMMEKLAGPEAWSQIEEKIMDEVLSIRDIVALLSDVAKYRWADLSKGPEAPAEVSPEGTGRVDPEPPAPQPRVVKRG